MADIFKDDRFSHLSKDPKFRRMPKNERKVKIDKRFKDMFTDKRFKLKYSVDKRGRPVNTSTNENLKKYYELSDDENDLDSGNESEDDTDIKKDESEKNKDKSKKENAVSKSKSTKGKEKTRKSKDQCEPQRTKANVKVIQQEESESDDDDNDYEDEEEEDGSEDDSDDEDIPDPEHAPDLARGEGNVESSSEEEDDDEENDKEDEEEDEFEHQWGELDKNVPEAEEISRRLAVCNMDWDRIKARDIFVLMNSFLPSGGAIKSVTIYPSEFGLQRMKEEATKGPMDLIKDTEAGPSDNRINQEDDDFDAEDLEGGSYHRERLRQYQLNRLKYYYAVVEMDSKETANHIYEECDGMEYESSAAKLDLRFIPDDMTFDQEPKSVCTEIPSTSSYQPSLFCTTALAQSKVDLTWDETDRDRVKVTMRDHKKVKGKNADDIKEDDFNAYLASSSDEEGEDPYGNLVEQSDDSENGDESDEDKQIEKYKSLLQTLKENESNKEDRDVEMEVSWEPGLKEATEKIVKKKQEDKGQTAWDKYLARRKEIKQERREKKKKLKQRVEEEVDDVREDADLWSDAEAAFSDDSIPDGVNPDDPFPDGDSDENKAKLRKKSKKKKKKKMKDDTKEQKQDKSREAELSLLMMEEEEDKKKHFSLKSLMADNKKMSKKERKEKEKTKDKSKTDEDFEINVADQRFGALYDSHLFNIDPSAPEFKRTKGVEAIIDEKLKRRKSEKVSGNKNPGNKLKRKIGDTEPSDNSQPAVMKVHEIDDVKIPKKDTSLASLVKSVKNKTHAYHGKKKK